MRIFVKDKRHFLWLPIPTALLYSRLAERILLSEAKRRGATLEIEQARRILEELRRIVRRHPKLMLVDIKDRHGARVQIRL